MESDILTASSQYYSLPSVFSPEGDWKPEERSDRTDNCPGTAEGEFMRRFKLFTQSWGKKYVVTKLRCRWIWPNLIRFLQTCSLRTGCKSPQPRRVVTGASQIQTFVLICNFSPYAVNWSHLVPVIKPMMMIKVWPVHFFSIRISVQIWRKSLNDTKSAPSWPITGFRKSLKRSPQQQKL